MPFIDNCLDCPCREGKAIGPRGDPASSIVLVGEAPGATEIEEGQPFVGAAGTRVLRPALAEAGLRDASVFITNSVACRPHDSVTPRAAAIRACHERLSQDLGAHHREVIVALGGTAIRAVTGIRRFSTTKVAPGTRRHAPRVAAKRRDSYSVDWAMRSRLLAGGSAAQCDRRRQL